ncbi:MAG TPA: addiction module protein [Planctomycetaceae bacterium]|nr:addiction module protein [Planctomycetaceae bacterium]
MLHIGNSPGDDMDISATLDEITALSVDERMRLVEAIWDSITAEPGQPALTDAQRQELERRLSAHKAAPGDVVPWEEVKSQALARLKQ